MDAADAAAVTPRDRLSFALFLVISLHAAGVFGVGFVWHGGAQERSTIEITLAQHRDSQAPENADFIAQSDQLGSGSADELAETTTPRLAEFPANEFHEVLAERQPRRREQEVQPVPAVLTTSAASAEQAPTATPVPDAAEDRRPPAAQDTDATPRSQIASLDARLARELQTDARAPRVRRLSSVSARRAEDAAYLQAWTRQVESVGNLNYPEEALRHELYGSPQLLVAIAPDGALKEVTLLASSGHPLLDQAAMRIVSLAAPFEPFPEAMREETRLLEIERTFQFRRSSG